MATATKKNAKSKKDEEFRSGQKKLAKKQNKNASNAVPEQRPQASQEHPDSQESEVYRKLRDNGDLNEEPMPKSAYDKAASKAQLKAAEKDERAPSVAVGAKIIVTEGPYEGQTAVVNELKYKNPADVAGVAGTPEARFQEVESVLCRTRGGRHALLSLAPDEFRIASNAEWGRREA